MLQREQLGTRKFVFGKGTKFVVMHGNSLSFPQLHFKML